MNSDRIPLSINLPTNKNRVSSIGKFQNMVHFPVF